MKLLLITLSLFLISLSSNAQTSFWTEDFDGTSCAAGSGCDPSIVSWTVVSLGGEGITANRWYVSDTEVGFAPPTCGSSTGADQSMHVGNISTSAAAFLFCPTGDCGAAYDDSGVGERTNKQVESPTINCTGRSGILVDFNYIENGQGFGDDASFLYYDGTTWATIPVAKSGLCGAQGRWTAAVTISLPASADNNPNVKIGFLWVNNGDGLASDPSFAVDDIDVQHTTTLPIELLYFNATYKNGNILLEWVTETEINNDYFTIERSEDGVNYTPISETNGAGNSNTSKYYSDVDLYPPPNKVLYYRLKQTDFDGKYAYSNIVAIRTGSNGYNITYANQNLSNSSVTEENSTIKIYDITGKIVYSNKVKEDQQINTSKFNSGIYIIKISSQDNLFVRKMKF